MIWITINDIEEDKSWTNQLEQEINQAYQKTITVEIVPFDGISGEFDIADVSKFGPDLVLLKPFLKRDNDW
ncbi:hypothetical protein MKX67_21300 [Cytobacillus sp. FSL W7-1323]|uniref:hypothetical protein n=1 Tax=Cytobacillus TaxID=2675230 RepID=UPI00278A9C8C|nr:hypothetical protein [Cytobacillus kochii]MDQ0185898.1 hypothetical protein [Cytobacillus kochii]MED1605040.1 hypothetical protein [Cytobacillus kochii]